jgi:hypothetical protein
MKVKVILAALIISLGSCTKRVTCEGVLYSPHGIPMPAETVNFNFYGTASSYPSGGTSCVTDKDGRFYFNLKVRKKFPMELTARTDSGYIEKNLGKPSDGTEFYEELTVHR